MKKLINSILSVFKRKLDPHKELRQRLVVAGVDLVPFHEISIRGRMAFSICCFRALIKKLGYEALDWNFLFYELWRFTSIQYVDTWLYDFASPWAVMDDVYSSEDYPYFTREQFDDLKKLYGSVNEDTRQVVDLMFEMCTVEMYGKVTKNGMSFESLESIVDVMVTNQVTLPVIDQFKK
ncbi:hypothetical protein [Chryseolinea lacunae]|uniref:Uncharacterized protein n=1 Tax=Chryseolinea lacunae TaxID=2801331 RepID=A0ABS1L1W3_9BACT|nr:hypothetical protein [Chryseolinea lacunae]MBL0745497.1 hypothetical protein [Chryseolinea lacunae]